MIDQTRIGVLINALVLEEYSDHEKEALLQIITHIADEGVAVILFACTDLQLLKPSY